MYSILTGNLPCRWHNSQSCCYKKIINSYWTNQIWKFTWYVLRYNSKYHRLVMGLFFSKAFTVFRCYETIRHAGQLYRALSYTWHLQPSTWVHNVCVSCVCVYPLFPHTATGWESEGGRARWCPFMRFNLSPSMENSRVCHGCVCW